MAGRETITIEDARIIFRNFSGRAGRFNNEGDRSFSLLLDEALANRLRDQGFNVKPLQNRDPDEPPRFHLPVKVSYKGRPPRVVLLSGPNRVALDQSTIGSVDFAEIEHADLTITPYDWEVNGNRGRKAYLRSAYITTTYDELDAKYMEEPSFED